MIARGKRKGNWKWKDQLKIKVSNLEQIRTELLEEETEEGFKGDELIVKAL